MSGPYRTPLSRPERFESFWIHLERRGTKVRRLRVALAALTLVPALAVVSTVAITKASADEPRHVMDKVHADPWGLELTPGSVKPFLGALPRDVVPSPGLQRVFAARANEIQKCYAEAARFDLELAGDLIVNVALRGAKHVSIVQGNRTLRNTLTPCIERQLQKLKFPATQNDEVVWVSYPLRFVR
jgi:hypothetical protein